MDAASLHLLSHGDSDLADTARPSWVLLDFSAYFVDRRNSTTAACMTRDNEEIQVTCFPAHPPRVSYCVHCRGVEPGDFAMEPKVIATDGNVVLLRVAIGSPNAMLCHTLYEYYIYKASGGTGGGPSLELLPHSSHYFFYDEPVGLLSRGTEYTVVALRDDESAFFRGSSIPGQYDFCLLDSERKVWSTKAVFVPWERRQGSNGEEGFRHETTNVVTIGGEPGTMAFVDLWRGILLFDVLHGDPILRYTMVPPQLSPRRGYCSPSFTRDTAVVNGHFKLVEFLDKISRVTGSHGGYINDGWVAATWSKEIFSPQEDSWCQGFKLESHNILVNHNPLLFELLPKLPGDEGKPHMILERLHTGHLMLGLHNGDIVNLMTKVELRDNKAWVIAVDMSDGMLQGVAEFGAERDLGISLTYTQSRISEHLILAPGPKGELKRARTPLLGSYSKKLLKIPMNTASAGTEDEEASVGSLKMRMI